MLIKRQKLLLTLLDALGEPVSHTDFQKLLFLFTQECEGEPFYEFVPYRFGGFSFTSYADKRKLIEKGSLADNDQLWQLTDAGRRTARRHSVDPLRAVSFCRRHSKLRGHALILEQYRRFPYFATRSELLDKLPLEPEDRERIESACPKQKAPGLLTIGYEGRSLENCLNALLRAGVTMLCDVRKNPLSRKYGFSKGALSKACNGVGISYEHLPELGIDSADRRNLETQSDYDALFAVYERTILPNRKKALESILAWVVKGGRVALICYERLPRQCHRARIAKALAQDDRLKRNVRHL